MDDFSFWLLEVVFLFFLILLNGFFVVFEYSFVKVRESEIEPLIQKGNVKAKLLKHLKENTDKYISATQLGVTLVNLLLGWLGEPVFVKIFSPILKLLGLNGSIYNSISVIIGVMLLSYFTIVIGELTPKVIALRYPLQIATWMSYPINIFYKTFKYFIILLENSAHFLLKIIGFKGSINMDTINSEEEIRYIIEEGSKSGVIDSTEQQLIEKIFEFNDKTAEDIMIPRNSIVALNINDSRDKIINIVIEQGYSRIPVYSENIDNIIGILYSKDLISAAEHRELILLHDLLRPVNFIPENKHIGEILKDFQKNHIHLGIVVNEHGGVEGLVTLEDIMEEIVGEIEDEYDDQAQDQPSIRALDEYRYTINALTPIEDFNEHFGSHFSDDDVDTIGGLVMHGFGHLPKRGESIELSGFEFKILQVDRRRLIQLQVTIPEQRTDNEME